MVDLEAVGTEAEFQLGTGSGGAPHLIQDNFQQQRTEDLQYILCYVKLM